MIASIWNRRLVIALEKARYVDSVFCAFNVNIDAKEYITAQRIKVAFLEDPDFINKVRASVRNPPNEIMTPADFFAGLYISMKEGKSLQWEIREKNKEMLQWFDEYFEVPDEKRMGGQSGIIANLLSTLGVKCYLYSPLLSKQQAQEFRENNIYFPAMEDCQFKAVPIRDAYRPDDDVKTNWVFEYKEGTQFPVDIEPLCVTAPRTNRFIVASRPQGLDPVFDKETESILPIIGTKVNKAILSGYQYLKEKYSDGQTVDDKIKVCMRQIDALRVSNPLLKIHMELAGIKNDSIRKSILFSLSQKMDSLGLNEVEIRSALDIIDAKKESWEIKEDENAYTLYKGMAKLLTALNLERIHLHNLGYHILTMKKTYPATPESARNAVLFASIVGTSRAVMGDFYSREPLSYELSIGKQLSISYTGMKQLELVAKKLKQDGMDINERKFMEEGILDMGDYYLILVPTQIAPNPQSTVGIGDSLSSSAFIADL